VNGKRPDFVTGRGVGAILATQNAIFQTKLILIDPVLSIADKISKKYRLLYPKMLIRTKVQMPKTAPGIPSENILILKDHKENEGNCIKIANYLTTAKIIQKDGVPLKDKINFAIQHFTDK